MSTTKVPINQSSTYTSTSTSAALTTALITHNSIPLIQATLLHELQASGWTASLRAYITQLMRSGECTRYEELMDRVLEKAMAGIVEDKGRDRNGTANGMNGSGKKEGDDGLRIPDKAIREGIRVVKMELAKVCEVVED